LGDLPGFELTGCHLADLEAKRLEHATDVIVEIDPRAQRHLPAGQEQPELPRLRALQVHRSVPAHLHRERDVAGVDPVGLDRHRAHRRLHVPGVDADHWQISRGQAVAQPRRQRPRLDAAM
jgi:hypothetical protein